MSKITFVGAGPVGCLAAIHFKNAGFDVEIFERRPDIRKSKIPAGRSINLALSRRGIAALEELGLQDTVLKNAVPMYGRMMHDSKSQISSSAYGIDDRYFINSISRGELNQRLLDYAENVAHISIKFSTRITGYDFESSQLQTETLDRDDKVISTETYQANHVISSDGSSSVLRAQMLAKASGAAQIDPLGYAYKELTIAASQNHDFQMSKNHLHIWPRGKFMLIALPNFDGSFTCTLFLPEHGSLASFEYLNTPEKVRIFFEEHFPDASRLIQNLEDSFFKNPTGNLATIKCHPWNRDEQMLLIGDAAHGIVPFFGQGLNCGFEDCSFLKASLKSKPSLLKLFSDFSIERKPSTDAIADLALENFIEMRDKVAQERFLFEKEIERELMRRFPDNYFSRYFLVTFSQIPYELALEVGHIQDQILNDLSSQKKLLSEVDFNHALHLIMDQLEPHNQQVREYLE